MVEKIVFIVPDLFKRYVQKQTFPRWLLIFEENVTYEEEKNRVVLMFPQSNKFPFRYIVLNFEEETVTFYSKKEYRAYANRYAHSLLQERKTPYEVKQMNFYLRPKEDADPTSK